jgi:hypothetical protein
MTITYEAKEDKIGALVSPKAKRRCLVLRYSDGHFCWVCGAFSTMAAAEKRAAELNKKEE